MKIISWNLNGLRAVVKRGNFTPLFDYNPDIICFQETKCEEIQVSEDIRNYKNYNSYFSHSKSKKGYSGVAIYSKIKPNKIEYGIGLKGYEDEGRVIIAYFDKFVLINCYFPNGGGGPERLKYKLDFYDAFLVFVNKLKKQNYNVVFCGDINVAHKEIDIARPKENEKHVGFLPIERAWMDEVVNAGWVDIFRNFYPNKKDVYTYWDQRTFARERNIGWRIDYFFTHLSYVNKVKKFTTLKDYQGSDHCPIVLDLDI